MSAGDFLQVYNDPGRCRRPSVEGELVVFIVRVVADDWDCVATCFFLDTAHNIIEYVERLWKILKPGGVWINFGSLSLRTVLCTSKR